MNKAGFQPFTNLGPAFRIGLSPVAGPNFLHVDEDTPRYLAEKRKLYAEQFGSVFMAEADTEAAQKEACQLITGQLGKKIDTGSLPPLASAALLVQDDLLLMRRDDAGWRLVAGSLCFPSSWNLAEKFGKPLEQIHGPVPGLAGKTSIRINRIFDALNPQSPLWRENWSIDGDDELRQDRLERFRKGSGNDLDLLGPLWFRSEYQTLHKLSGSGDILFTVKILLKNIEDLSNIPAGRQVLSALCDQLGEMNNEELRYKGLVHDTVSFQEKLSTLAAEHP